jgi:hypothetical protein
MEANTSEKAVRGRIGDLERGERGEGGGGGEDLHLDRCFRAAGQPKKLPGREPEALHPLLLLAPSLRLSRGHLWIGCEADVDWSPGARRGMGAGRVSGDGGGGGGGGGADRSGHQPAGEGSEGKREGGAAFWMKGRNKRANKRAPRIISLLSFFPLTDSLWTATFSGVSTFVTGVGGGEALVSPATVPLPTPPAAAPPSRVTVSLVPPKDVVRPALGVVGVMPYMAR